jgi:ribosomal protein S18 acetylase RimI-like enzyme
MNIRYANENDASLLADLGRKTFNDTFASQNTPEDIALYLSNSFSEEKQTKELKDPNVIFLIAENDGSPIGFVKLNAYNTIEGISGDKPIEIERIYAIKEYIGKGVGAELMKRSIQEAQEKGFDCLWLGVWEENPRAIRFYEKFGFKKVSTHTFLLGTDPQNDFIMELSFTE